MLNLAAGNINITDTPCWQKLFYNTTAEKVMAQLELLKPGESFILNGRVKGTIRIGNMTLINVRFINTKITNYPE